jgi:adenylate cyclase
VTSFATPEDEWREFLRGTHPHLQHGSPLRFVPSNPRCKLCKAPFRAPGALILRRYGYAPWEKNPNICGRCFRGIASQAKACPSPDDASDVRGADVEVSLLFADVRGSSKLAREMPVFEFTRLMNRFYKVSRDVLVEHDAIIEKFVGDAVVGLFVPFLAGPDHARKAFEAADALLRATGHRSADAPWVPLVGSAGASDFTALGDPVNIAAHLASQAAIGEILVTTEAAAAASLPSDGFERRSVVLKGHPMDALVVGTTAEVP